MNWLLIGMLFLLMVIYAIMNSGMGQMWQKPEENKIEEFAAENLRLTVYYDRKERSAIANFKDFDKYGIIYITVFLTEPVSNEVQRQVEGKTVDAGPAIVRCKAGTNEVLGWTYKK